MREKLSKYNLAPSAGITPINPSHPGRSGSSPHSQVLPYVRITIKAHLQPNTASDALPAHPPAGQSRIAPVAFTESLKVPAGGGMAEAAADGILDFIGGKAKWGLPPDCGDEEQLTRRQAAAGVGESVGRQKGVNPAAGIQTEEGGRGGELRSEGMSTATTRRRSTKNNNQEFIFQVEILISLDAESHWYKVWTKAQPLLVGPTVHIPTPVPSAVQRVAPPEGMESSVTIEH